MPLSEYLKQLISSNGDIIELLKYLRQIEPTAYFSAGLIRNWIWSYLHDQAYTISNIEIDVIYFDSLEKNYEKLNNLKHHLELIYPNIQWDITNQAFVHQWYRTELGDQIAPYSSILHAMSYWPETATAIAIKLTTRDEIEIIAPFGLDDLFALKLRWNDRLVSREVFEQRVKSKRFLQKWPKLKIVN